MRKTILAALLAALALVAGCKKDVRVDGHRRPPPVFVAPYPAP